MKGKNTGLVVALVLLNLALGSWLVFNKKNEKKIGYVFIQEVFNDFDMKKEMEIKFKHTQSVRQRILDSLGFELKVMDKNLQAMKNVKPEDVHPLKVREEEFIAKKKQYTQDDAVMSKQFDKQIIAQLNQYVKDYGKEKGYDYVLGNDGNGSLMYASEADNLTKEVIQYINDKYKGVK
jgi:outer membrane protein